MRLIFVLFLLTALPAAAQDRAGRDTPGEWAPTHYRPFGLWDSICDQRQTGDRVEKRCYLRYVDVFSPHPDFAAQFAFVTPDGADYRVEFGTERGTRFTEEGFRIETDGTTVWQTSRRGCLRGGDCVFDGADAADLIGRMVAGGRFHFDFNDRHGVDRRLTWDLAKFGAALDDLRREAAARGLD